MASVHERVYSHLKNSTAVASQVGGSTAARVRALNLRQGETYPAISYQVISEVDEAEAFRFQAPFKRARVQVSSWGDSYSATHALDKQVHEVMRRWRSSTSDPEVIDVFPLNRVENYDRATEKFLVARDFQVHYIDSPMFKWSVSKTLGALATDRLDGGTFTRTGTATYNDKG